MAECPLVSRFRKNGKSCRSGGEHFAEKSKNKGDLAKKIMQFTIFLLDNPNNVLRSGRKDTSNVEGSIKTR